MNHETMENASLRSDLSLPEEEILLTPQDVARRFQVPVTWVYGCCRPRAKSPMPHLKIGRYLRFEEQAVRQFIERYKRGYSRMRAAA